MVVTEIYLSCDGDCGQHHGVDTRNWTTVKQQRKSAKAAGWKYIKGKDYCPSCFEKQKTK